MYYKNMSRAVIAPDEYYHIYNRGVNKQPVFLNDADYVRMLLLIIFLQSPKTLYNAGWYVKNFIKTGSFGFSDETINELLSDRTVELVSFILMPNHFHLFVRELEEGGISKYLQRIEIAYTKYFNIKYRKSGYLLQGPYQSVHVSTNEQVLHLSAYIHKNCSELKGWRGKEQIYPWSSYQDVTGENRWGQLLKHDIISEQFSNPEEYKYFVRTSGAKELDEDLWMDSIGDD